MSRVTNSAGVTELRDESRPPKSNKLLEGVGSWRTTTAAAATALMEEGDFAVHAGVYGKVQAEPDVTSNGQKRRRGGEDGWVLPELGYLAICVGYVSCVSICLY
jgi:hypothetical protein